MYIHVLSWAFPRITSTLASKSSYFKSLRWVNADKSLFDGGLSPSFVNSCPTSAPAVSAVYSPSMLIMDMSTNDLFIVNALSNV